MSNESDTDFLMEFIFRIIRLIIFVIFIYYGTNSIATLSQSSVDRLISKYFNPAISDIINTENFHSIETNPKKTPYLPSEFSQKFDTLKCQICAEEGILINIWSHPDRSGLVAKVPHGTGVEIIGTVYYHAVKYYKIKVSGEAGYVRYWFIEGYR